MMFILLMLMCALRPVLLQERPEDFSDRATDDTSDDLKWVNDDRIVGGENAKISDYPYLVQVLNAKGVVGGGSIITKRFIVTAAHLSGKRPVVAVLVGSEIRGMGTRYEVEVIKHEHYSGSEGGWNNDIALLRLEEPLEFSENVKKIGLATKSSTLEQGPNAEVIGFGVTETGKVSTTLQKAKVRLLSSETCKKFSDESFSAKNHLCAANYNEKRDACKGDSGGPLITWSSKGDAVLIGLVSYGAENCTAFLSPGFYTRISSYLDWISKKLKKHGGNQPRRRPVMYGGMYQRGREEVEDDD